MLPTTGQVAQKERDLWELYLLIGGVIALAALVMLGNLPRMSAWLLMLLTVGVGQALLFPANISYLGGIVIVVLWVTFRQATGLWTPATMPQDLLEIGGLGLNMYLAIRFRPAWQAQQDELTELRALKKIVAADDVGAGLLPRDVAELRLLEEIDRARQFHRPLGLLAVQISPLDGEAVGLNESRQVFAAVARQISSASLVHDTPFRQSATQIGLILPERTWEDLYKDVDMIAGSLGEAAYVDAAGQPKLIRDCVRLNFGLGTFQGETTGEIDLVRAAEDSLGISNDLAAMAMASSSAYALPATPIVEPEPALAKSEE